MGGREASRGFLYQAFASVLEAMCQKNWDKIYIEFDSDDDKVDIALEENNRIFKSIQVKSTINTFNKNSLKKWLQDLINDDVGSTEFELFLIGQCDNDNVTFINSIDKFQRNKLKENLSANDYWAIRIKNGIVVEAWLSNYPLNITQLSAYTQEEQRKQIHLFEKFSESKIIGYYCVQE